MIFILSKKCRLSLIYLFIELGKYIDKEINKFKRISNEERVILIIQCIEQCTTLIESDM